MILKLVFDWRNWIPKTNISLWTFSLLALHWIDKQLFYNLLSWTWVTSNFTNFQIVSALLVSPDISLNNKTPEGWTALVAAADKGHHGLVRTLLKHRATDVNVRDNQSKYIPFFQ